MDQDYDVSEWWECMGQILIASIDSLVLMDGHFFGRLLPKMTAFICFTATSMYVPVCHMHGACIW